MKFIRKILIGLGNAFDALKGSKIRTALTVLGVLIGVMAIILLVSIGQGVRVQVSKEIEGLGANLFFVMPSMGGGGKARHGPASFGSMRNKLTYSDVIAIQTRSSIPIQAIPVLRSSVVTKNGNLSYFTTVFGTSDLYSEALSQKVVKGRFFTATMVNSRRRVCVIGKTVADELFANKDPLLRDITILGEKFKVIGVFEEKGSTMGQSQDDMVVVPITSAQSMLGTNAVNQIVCRALGDGKLEEAKRIVTRILSRRLIPEEDFQITDQKDIMDTMNRITGILSVALGGIAGISLLVGGIGIMNIMLVTVTERTREIGIRKAIGAKESDILMQFIIESIMISATGGVMGILLGYGGSLAIQKWVPTSVTPWSVALSFGFSVFIGVFFGVYPASKAAKLDPIVALRSE